MDDTEIYLVCEKFSYATNPSFFMWLSEAEEYADTLDAPFILRINGEEINK